MFCGVTKQIRQLRFNEDSEMRMNEISQMLNASRVRRQKTGSVVGQKRTDRFSLNEEAGHTVQITSLCIKRT